MSDSEYSDSSFWDKVKNSATVAGREVIEKALYLYYSAQNPETPAWARTTIYGALAYLISPIDAIPDLTPVVGYVDDLGAFAAALGIVAAYIDESTKERAREKLKSWFS